MDALSLSDLTFGYLSEPILNKATFSVPQGSFSCLVGENGCGKSTLLKLILGALKPQEGNISLFGKPFHELTDLRCIGYVPQVNVVNKITFPITCRELVVRNLYRDFGIVKIARKKHYQQAEQKLREMGLEDYLHTPFNELSGGLQQRTMITRALMNNPRLLIMDEPTAGVDHSSKERFFDLLESLRCNHDLTVLLVTHELELIAQHVTIDNVFRLEQGRIIHA